MGNGKKKNIFDCKDEIFVIYHSNDLFISISKVHIHLTQN